MENLRALDVADNAASGVVEELDADLGHGTGVAGSPQDVLDLGQLDLSSLSSAREISLILGVSSCQGRRLLLLQQRGIG